MPETAISPHHMCEASVVIRDLSTKLTQYKLLTEKLNFDKQTLCNKVEEKRELFNNAWLLHFSEIPDFWTTEAIISSFKVRYFVKGLELLK